MTDVVVLYERALAATAAHIHAIDDGQWANPTPCAEWDVRALLQHLVYEWRWVAPLLAGRTIAEVGDAFDGDLLGADPLGAWDGAAAEARAAMQEAGAMDRVVHLSFGDIPAGEYAWQLLTDLVIHGWDVARATGGDERIGPELIEAVTAYLEPQVAGWRAGGSFADPVPVSSDAAPQDRLLAMTGRDPRQPGERQSGP